MGNIYGQLQYGKTMYCSGCCQKAGIASPPLPDPSFPQNALVTITLSPLSVLVINRDHDPHDGDYADHFCWHFDARWQLLWHKHSRMDERWVGNCCRSKNFCISFCWEDHVADILPHLCPDFQACFLFVSRKGLHFSVYSKSICLIQTTTGNRSHDSWNLRLKFLKLFFWTERSHVADSMALQGPSPSQLTSLLLGLSRAKTDLIVFPEKVGG